MPRLDLCRKTSPISPEQNIVQTIKPGSVRVGLDSRTVVCSCTTEAHLQELARLVEDGDLLRHCWSVGTLGP